MRKLILVGLFSWTLLLLPLVSAWGSNKDRVRLQDVGAITLEAGRKTNAKRVSAIPQLRCVGGTAGCRVDQPTVVQCTNRGFDGYDVQWECKASMESAYQFGRIQVSCEGYDYPDDPYVLRGSCGLEYDLDLTKQGYQQQREGHYYDDEPYHRQHHQHYDSSSFSWSKIITLVILGTVLYWLVKCYWFGTGNNNSTRRSAAYSASQSGTHTTGTGGSYNTGTGTGGTGGGLGGGGFWSGAATGGMMGYLLGNRRGYGGYGGYGGGYGHGYSYPRHGGGWGGGWGGGGGGWGGGGSRWSGGGGGSRRSSGSSSRTTSGFGGTSRR